MTRQRLLNDIRGLQAAAVSQTRVFRYPTTWGLSLSSLEI